MNTENEFLGQSAFRVAVLPARAAYLIESGSLAGFRRAILEASSRWGGATEPIVQVSEEGITSHWDRLRLERSNIDGLVNVDADANLAAALAQKLARPLVDIAQIDEQGVTSCTAHPADLNLSGLDFGEPTLIAPNDASLWELAAAGGLSPQQELMASDVGARFQRSLTPESLGRAQLKRTTWLDTTIKWFTEQRVGLSRPSPAVFWLTEPESLDDCVAFWNLRALRPLSSEGIPMVLLPDAGLDSWSEFGQSIGGLLARRSEVEPGAVVTSMSVAADRQREVMESFGFRPDSSRRTVRITALTGLVKRPTMTYSEELDPVEFVDFGRDYGMTRTVTVQVYREGTVFEFPSPVEFVNTSRAMFRFDGQTLAGFPRRAVVSELFDSRARWHKDSLELEGWNQANLRFVLDVPSLSEAAWAVLDSATTTAKLSDKGQLAGRLSELALGKTLLVDELVALIGHLTTPRSKMLLRELRSADRRGVEDRELVEIAAQWGGRSERRHRSLHQIPGDRQRLLVAAEALAAAGWAERGLQVVCKRCGLSSFVPLVAAGAEPCCPACRSTVDAYEANDAGLVVRYRLDPLVDRASDQGVVPHLLAESVLRNADMRTVLLPGVDVVTTDGASEEVDLFGIHAGRVFAGEAKISPSDFTDEQIRRDVSLTARLFADVHVAVASRPLAQPQRETMRALCRSAQIDLVLIEGSQMSSFELS